MSTPRKIRLTAQEQVVAQARIAAYGLGARLILDPSDPAVHEDLADYLSNEGAQAMAAMRELGALTADQVEARLKQVTSEMRPFDGAVPPWRQDPSAARTARPVRDEDPDVDFGVDDAHEEIDPVEDGPADDDEFEDAGEVPQQAQVEDQPGPVASEDELADDDDAWLREYDKLAALAEGEG